MSMLIIGESINGTIQKVGQAILDRNEAYLRELARVQYECGANFRRAKVKVGDL